MKTAIIYSSKHNTTEKVAQKIKTLLNKDCTLFNLKENNIPDFSEYDNIILGSAIYAGKPMSSMIQFCDKNKQELLSKKLALFICGMHPSEEDRVKEFENAYPAEFHSHAIAKGFMGGAFLFEKMNFFERFIIKKIAKTNKSCSAIDEDKIKQFADTINRL